MYIKKTDKVYRTHKSFLTRCRRSLKISADVVARTMGISVSNLYNIEQDPLGRDLHTIKKYCAIIGIDWKNAIYCLDIEDNVYNGTPTNNKNAMYVMSNGSVVKASDRQDYVIVNGKKIKAKEE